RCAAASPIVSGPASARCSSTASEAFGNWLRGPSRRWKVRYTARKSSANSLAWSALLLTRPGLRPGFPSSIPMYSPQGTGPGAAKGGAAVQIAQKHGREVVAVRRESAAAGGWLGGVWGWVRGGGGAGFAGGRRGGRLA